MGVGGITIPYTTSPDMLTMNSARLPYLECLNLGHFGATKAVSGVEHLRRGAPTRGVKRSRAEVQEGPGRGAEASEATDTGQEKEIRTRHSVLINSSVWTRLHQQDDEAQCWRAATP